jgi:DNA-binding winged helix-turn-helix (wHTH) protein
MTFVKDARTMDAQGDFRLGEWLVQPSLCRVSRGEQSAHLRPKVMDVLVCLAGKAGKVVSKQALIDAVWAKEFIADTALSRAVFELRQALGDDDARPRYVETIAKRGYRLVAAVEPVGQPAGAVIATSPFVVVTGEREVRLVEGENLIGRGTDVPLHLDSMEASRHHARIVVAGGRAVLEDLGSMNGTMLRGHRVKEPMELEDRDVIVIGGVSLVFRCTSGDGSTIPAHHC